MTPPNHVFTFQRSGCSRMPLGAAGQPAVCRARLELKTSVSALGGRDGGAARRRDVPGRAQRAGRSSLKRRAVGPHPAQPGADSAQLGMARLCRLSRAPRCCCTAAALLLLLPALLLPALLLRLLLRLRLLRLLRRLLRVPQGQGRSGWRCQWRGAASAVARGATSERGKGRKAAAAAAAAPALRLLRAAADGRVRALRGEGVSRRQQGVAAGRPG